MKDKTEKKNIEFNLTFGGRFDTYNFLIGIPSSV